MEATDCVELKSVSRVVGDKLIELKAKIKDSRKTIYIIYKITRYKMALYNPIYMTRLYIL